MEVEVVRMVRVLSGGVGPPSGDALNTGFRAAAIGMAGGRTGYVLAMLKRLPGLIWTVGAIALLVRKFAPDLPDQVARRMRGASTSVELPSPASEPAHSGQFGTIYFGVLPTSTSEITLRGEDGAFLSWRTQPPPDRWEFDAGYLEGNAGIGLALADALGLARLPWDRPLALSLRLP